MRWGIALIILSVIVYYLLLFFRYRGTKEVHRLEQPGNNNNEIIGESKFDNRQFWTEIDKKHLNPINKESENTFAENGDNETIPFDDDLVEVEYENDSNMARGVSFEEIVSVIRVCDNVDQTDAFDSVMKQIEQNREKIGNMIADIEND